MIHKIYIDSELVKEMDVSEFSLDLIPEEFLCGVYQKSVHVEAQVKAPKPVSMTDPDPNLSVFFKNLEIPADDGFRAVWSGYWSKDDGFTDLDTANKLTIECLFG